MNLPATPAKLWTERYETLRRHFLENQALFSVQPLGLALLRQNGLAGWMRLWQRDGTTTSEARVPSPTAAVLPVVPFWQQELTALLAHMTAYHLQPIHS
jgi:hypothetical protein